MPQISEKQTGEFYGTWVIVYRKMQENPEYAKLVKEKYGTEILLAGKDEQGREHFIVKMPKEFPWPSGHPRRKE